MTYVNSSVNPILYNLTSSRFRSSLYRMVTGMCKNKQENLIRTFSSRPGSTIAAAVGSSSYITSPVTLQRSCSSPMGKIKRNKSSSKYLCPWAHHEKPRSHEGENHLLHSSSINNSCLKISNVNKRSSTLRESPFHDAELNISPCSSQFSSKSTSPLIGKSSLQCHQRTPFVGRSKSLTTKYHRREVYRKPKLTSATILQSTKSQNYSDESSSSTYIQVKTLAINSSVVTEINVTNIDESFV